MGIANTKADSALPDFNKLWNYGKPGETREQFLAILPRAKTSGDQSYYTQLLTQIARTHGLESNFDECHATLDRVEQLLTPDLILARIRYLLERGRAFNSSGKQKEAIHFFIQAYELGKSDGEMSYAIDAIHMIAIASQSPDEQVEWNLKGIQMAEADASTKKWLNALYNNIGESYLTLKDYGNARYYFHKLAELQKQKSGSSDMYTLKDEARAARLGGNPKESLVIIEPILTKLLAEFKDDGWIREEMAESLLAIGKTIEAKPHFVKAYELLSTDNYCIQHEKEKLTHLKEMSN